jgi:transketolase
MYENEEMRVVLGSGLEKLMETNEKIVVIDADLARANGTLGIRKRFPDRALDVGIAESNMASVAAGLASYGFEPFIFTFCPFATRRICDQVMISIAYAKQNVKIVGTDPGISAELNGGTHMSMEDISVLRSIPNMVIFEPVDGDQLAKALPQILAFKGPMYIRLFRKVPAKTFFQGEYTFDLFKADLLSEGNDVSIFASGIEVKEAMEAASLLKKKGISAEIINVHTIKPIDKQSIITSVKKTGCVVTCENHNIIGGLGSAIAETLSAEYPSPIEFIGSKEHFCEVGRMPYLSKKFGLDAESIVKAAIKSIKRKK